MQVTLKSTNSSMRSNTKYLYNSWYLKKGGEHKIQSAGDTLQKGAPEICVSLLTSVIPINSTKRKRKRERDILLHAKMPVVYVKLLK